MSSFGIMRIVNDGSEFLNSSEKQLSMFTVCIYHF